MSYDVKLAERIRSLLATEKSVREKKMFGGVAFLVDGKMAVAASGQGGILLRIDPTQRQMLLKKPHTNPFVMRNRTMEGWLRVEAEGVQTQRQLEPWVRRCVEYVRALEAENESL